MSKSMGTYPKLASMSLDEITYETIEGFCNQQIPEDIDLDYKSDWPNDLEKVLCAFANTQGGLVLIGIEEVEKTQLPKCPPCGVVGSHDVLREKARNIAFDAIYPPVLPEIKVIPIPPPSNRYIVFIRVQPTRLMHSVDRRTRIYIRSADSNHGYSLASLADLKWLWDQRANSDELRGRLLQTAQERTLSPAITTESAEAKILWAKAPILTITTIPEFPGQMLPIEYRHLLDIIYSLGELRSSWTGVASKIPWNKNAWRSVAGGVALSDRGTGSDQQYIEIGEYAHYQCSIVIAPRSVTSLPIPRHSPENCISAYALLSYLELALRFGAKFYQKIGFRGPLSIIARFERVAGLLLYYEIPSLNPLSLEYLSQACPDPNIILLQREQSALELPILHEKMMMDASNALLWAFGISWTSDQVKEWYSRLSRK
jgi:hypothetical protein